MHTRLMFCRNINYEDKIHASLFAIGEALIPAKKSSWVVRTIDKNKKLLKQKLEG